MVDKECVTGADGKTYKVNDIRNAELLIAMRLTTLARDNGDIVVPVARAGAPNFLTLRKGFAEIGIQPASALETQDKCVQPERKWDFSEKNSVEGLQSEFKVWDDLFHAVPGKLEGFIPSTS